MPANLCIGSWQAQEDVHTTVCLANSYFFQATSRTKTSTNWYSLTLKVNAICGLGKGVADNRSYSFLSQAVYQEQISSLVYSFEIDASFSSNQASKAFQRLKELHEGPLANVKEVQTDSDPAESETMTPKPYQFRSRRSPT